MTRRGLFDLLFSIEYLQLDLREIFVCSKKGKAVRLLDAALEPLREHSRFEKLIETRE